MNKKEKILVEAKRLFGRYGYRGFTLKQLASACQMTPPALYYFFSGKADLFRECLLSELEARNAIIVKHTEKAKTLEDFAKDFAYHAIEICGANQFRTGRAKEEIIHLPAEMHDELKKAWHEKLIAPIEQFLERVFPAGTPGVSRVLMATFMINIATFAATEVEEFSADEMSSLFIAVATGITVSSKK